MMNAIYADCRKQALHYEYHHAKCHYAQGRYAECRGAGSWANKEGGLGE